MLGAMLRLEEPKRHNSNCTTPLAPWARGHQAIGNLLKSCDAVDPSERPNIRAIISELKKL